MPDLVDVGPFRLIRPLARGGMGQVWLGQHPSGLPVAIKVIDAQEHGEIVRNEVRAAAALDHPHIVVVLDVGIVDEQTAEA